MLASGPYRKLLPFGVLEGIKISTGPTDGTISVSLTISNETQSPRNNMGFSNYVYLSNDRREIEYLGTNVEALAAQIRRDTENCKSFQLQKQDFVPKAYINKDANTQAYHYQYTTDRVINQTSELFALVAVYKKTDTTYIIGNSTREQILSKGRTSTTSNLYRLNETISDYGKEGSIWPGSVHRHNNTLMAGNNHVRENHPHVSSERVLNIKTKDMRVLTLAQNLNLASEPTRITNPSYLSPITLSRSRDGNVHGLFSLDHLLLAQNKTNYGYLIKNSLSLLAAASIQDIVVFSRVIKEDAAGNDLTPARTAPCGIKQISMFKEVASLKRGLQIVETSGEGSILTLSFNDSNAAKYSSNLIEYKVEVSLTDKTRESIAWVAQLISSGLKTLESARNRRNATMLKMVIDSYLTAVSFVLGPAAFGILSGEEWQQHLLSLVATPGTTDTTMISTVSEVIREFGVKLGSLIGPTKNITANGPNYNSKIYNSKKERVQKLVKVFDEKIKISDSHGVGLDYIDDIVQDTAAAMPVISFKQMKSRASDEVTKFSINNPTAGKINTLGFMTPRAASLRANPIVVPTMTLTNETRNFVPLIRSTQEGNSITNIEPSKTDKTNTKEILGTQGISLVKNEVSLRKLVFDKKIVAPTEVDSRFYLSDTSPFTQVDSPADLRNSGSSRSILESRELMDRPTTTMLASTLVNESVTSFKPITKMVNTSEISGSLALQKATEDSSAITDVDTMTSVINFGSIVQVQYLAPYEESIGVKQQNWRLLDETAYNNAVKNNRGLVCRLAPVSKTLDAPSAVNLQPLTSIFTMGPAPKKMKTPSYQRQIEQIQNSFGKLNNESLTYLTMPDILYAKNVPMTRPSKQTSRSNTIPTRSTPAETTVRRVGDRRRRRQNRKIGGDIY
jgi:hypothetical protein